MNFTADYRTPRDRASEELRCTCGNSNNTRARAAVSRSTRENAAVRSEGRSNSRRSSHLDECLADMPLAMAYVPMQVWRNLYDAESGLCSGTVFRELEFPWYPTPCRKEYR